MADDFKALLAKVATGASLTRAFIAGETADGIREFLAIGSESEMAWASGRAEARL